MLKRIIYSSQGLKRRACHGLYVQGMLLRNAVTEQASCQKACVAPRTRPVICHVSVAVSRSAWVLVGGAFIHCHERVYGLRQYGKRFVCQAWLSAPGMLPVAPMRHWDLHAPLAHKVSTSPHLTFTWAVVEDLYNTTATTMEA